MIDHIRSSWKILIQIILVLITLMTMTAASPASIRIQVKVTDCATGFPISGAAVRVPTSQLRIDKTIAYTSSNGIATIYPVKPGDMAHRVEVSAYPYEMKSVTQWITADTYLELRICLDKITTPTNIPTKTITPSPTLIPTVDVAVLASTCADWITTKINSFFPAVEEANSELGSISTSEKISGISDMCKADLSCATTGISGELATSTANLLIQSGGTIESVLQFIGTLFEPPASSSCIDTNHFMIELTKALSIQGFSLSVILLDPLTMGKVSDPQGRQSGFLPEVGIMQAIPGSSAIHSAQTNAIFLPANQLKNLVLTGNSGGISTLKLVHTIPPFVLEASFNEIFLPEGATAELVFNGLITELIVSEAGTTKRISSTQLQAYEMIKKEPINSTAASEPVPLPVITLPATTATPETNLPFSLPCGTISAPILLGMVLWLNDSKRHQP
jgi:hypothetical protein